MESISTGYYDIDSATHHQSLRNRRLLQSGLNYYDNTAHLHDPLLADFKSGDPKFTDYPSLNHYSHCGANFANAVDPFGQDIFLFDKRGNLIHIYETEEDEIQIADRNGKALSGTVLYLDGTAILNHKQNIEADKNTKYDMYRISTDENGMNIFKFLAENTEVEWTLVQTSEAGAEINYLTTSHKEDMEVGGAKLLKKGIFKSGFLRNHIHNHPGGTSRPSGLYQFYEVNGKFLSGDIESAQDFNSFNNSPLNFSIYLPGGKSIQYNPDSFEFSKNNIVNLLRKATPDNYMRRLLK